MSKIGGNFKINKNYDFFPTDFEEKTVETNFVSWSTCARRTGDNFIAPSVPLKDFSLIYLCFFFVSIGMQFSFHFNAVRKFLPRKLHLIIVLMKMKLEYIFSSPKTWSVPLKIWSVLLILLPVDPWVPDVKICHMPRPV